MQKKQNFFKLNNGLFDQGFTPIQFVVYSYLVCCTGNNTHCWPSVQNIATKCRCSKNAVRSALNFLVDSGYIERVYTYEKSVGGNGRQSNNRYFVHVTPVQEMDSRRCTQWRGINKQDAV